MVRRVKYKVLDRVAIVTLDAPPVNALFADLRAGLWSAFQKIASDAQIDAAVLLGTGDWFSAGADLDDLNKGRGRPSLGALCDLIDGLSKPVVAALNGPALGGGAELAMACHYRIAQTTATIGLPDLALGLVPGAGGTQRLPRLIGVDRALAMILTGRGIAAEAAGQLGLVDGVAGGDLATAAQHFARSVSSEGKGPRPAQNDRKHLSDAKAALAAVAAARASLEGDPRHAALRAVDCVEAAVLLPRPAGFAFETDAYDRCLTHPQSVALRHMFVAERRADDALLLRKDGLFEPVPPMGASVVARLQKALRAAADHLVNEGVPPSKIDAVVLDYGFAQGPFGTEGGAATPGSGAEDTLRRILAALVAEGGQCVAQGAVQTPADIDALAVHGIGFPRLRGGPMRAAQTLGLIGLRRDMRAWSQDSDLWTVPEILDAAIKQAAGFDGL